MEDQFEKFVKGNAPHFDSFDVPDGAWEEIQKAREKDLGGKKTKPKRIYLHALRRIAAVLVLVLAGYGLFSLFNGPSRQQIVEQLPTEIREMDEYYEAQIASTWNQLNEQHPNNELVSQEVSEELDMLQEEKDLLIDELKENFANQKVVEELIQIYRLRLEILEEVLNTLNEEKERDYDAANDFNT